MSGLRYAVEGRSLVAVAHLALARRQMGRDGTLGYNTKDKIKENEGITAENFAVVPSLFLFPDGKAAEVAA